jgi:hypothetical protein
LYVITSLFTVFTTGSGGGGGVVGFGASVVGEPEPEDFVGLGFGFVLPPELDVPPGLDVLADGSG